MFPTHKISENQLHLSCLCSNRVSKHVSDPQNLWKSASSFVFMVDPRFKTGFWPKNLWKSASSFVFTVDPRFKTDFVTGFRDYSGQQFSACPEIDSVKMLVPVPVANGSKTSWITPWTWHNSLPETPSLASSETKTRGGGNNAAWRLIS